MNLTHPPIRTSRLATLAALFAVYLFWGGTYLGIRLAVRTIPPFLMAGSRFLIAGLAVAGYAALRAPRRPGWVQWRDAGIVGALLLLGGNGILSWAEQRVPSNLAALLIATVPLWMVLMALPGRNGRRPSPLLTLGLGLGFAGIAVLVRPGADSGIDPLGAGALLLAALCWSAGSIYSRRARLPEPPLLAVGLQMIVGGALLIGVSAGAGEWRRLQLAAVAPESWLGLGYLVLFGSIVAYNAYIWLLKHADPGWVSTYAFVNPVVAVFLGWLVAGERLTPRAWASTLIIVLSVAVITFDRNRKAA